jgi:hypothetical protein
MVSHQDKGKTYGRSTRWLSLRSKWAAGAAAAHTVNIRHKPWSVPRFRLRQAYSATGSEAVVSKGTS